MYHSTSMCHFSVQKTILWHGEIGLLMQEAGNVWGQASAGSLTVNSYCDLSYCGLKKLIATLSDDSPEFVNEFLFEDCNDEF